MPTDATSFGLLVVPGTEPKVGQNRIHLDLTTTSAQDQRDLVADLLDRDRRYPQAATR